MRSLVRGVTRRVMIFVFFSLCIDTPLSPSGAGGRGSAPELWPAYSRTRCLPFVLADFVSLALPHAAELAHFVARPLPSETAALGFAGGPGQDEESVSPAPVASARTIYC